MNIHGVHGVRRIAVLVALLFLAGCYETDFPVIEAGKGGEVPGLAGTYSIEGAGRIVIEDKTASNGFEYLLRDDAEEEFELLAEKVQDKTWLLQLGRTKPDGSMSYLFLFLGKSGANFVFRIPNLMDESGVPEKLAAEHEVEVVPEEPKDGGEMRLLLQGTRGNVHAFLRAHPGKVKLEDMAPLVRQ